MTSSADPRTGNSGVKARGLTRDSVVRPLVGATTVLVIVGVISLAAALFRGAFTETVPITVLSERAGLVMNPEARVKMIGVQVGQVSSIEQLPDGRAAIHLAIDPAKLQVIPSNVLVDIGATTIFGAKSIQLVPPVDPSPQPIRAGQVLEASGVSVESDTVFEQLTSVLSRIDPAKLNETLGSLAAAFNGRGERFGRTLSDFNRFLADLEPSLANLGHDIEVAPSVLNAYADAAQDLVHTADSATRISRAIVEEEHNLDAFLVSTIGLADIGNDVVGSNRQPLSDVLRLLLPTTDLTSKYHEGLNCALAGMVPLLNQPPLPVPGVIIDVSLTLGVERYRYPQNLPKVAAKGGPQCLDLPDVPPQTREPYVVTDNGTNPAEYGNQGILLNSDALKQWLFGPVDGPPRNSAQIGQPG